VLQDDDMTTFTSEDRISATVDTFKWNPYQQQESIQFFWPLTEQIPLELDYTECVKYSNLLTYPLNDGTAIYTMPLWGAIGTNSITPQLTITPSNPIGTLSIGGINIGLEKKPNLLQRLLHKLLGFDWKDK
jgi:hypothetical protein